MALDKQIRICSIDTSNFYSKQELYLHNLINKVKREKKQVRNKIEYYEDVLITTYNYSSSQLKDILKENYEFNNDKSIRYNEEYYLEYKNIYSNINKKITSTKDKLLLLLNNKAEQNDISNGKHHIRILKQQTITEENVISVFDSFLIRTLGIKENDFTDDFMVIQTYYFDIIRDLICNGFMYNGEKYIYYTSSAGQIRQKKTVFIKESVWNKYEKTLMCGLTIDSINKKGGNNPNKHLAYLALTNSATDEWKDFDIDKSIVIDDFETDVFGTYDLIDDVDYSVKRVSDYVPIPHTDGVGMILPKLSRKNFMIRLAWVKGLLGVFDFVEFIKQNNCSPVIKDIYGIEHNIIDEDIQIIFTKSQFKMWKYYDSWEQYKEYYKLYNCTAGITNLEEDRIRNATINYQMLQTLTDITDEEIKAIASKSITKLTNLCSSIDNIKEVFGATACNQYKTPMQEAIMLYPNLINDEFLKDKLREIKNKLVKMYKAGKLEVNGKYTFLLPDFYAACEYWFMGIENPKGLLYDGEVYCDLFTNTNKLDCLRSPHLFKEHAVRINVACKDYGARRQEISKWFITNGIYTSTHDLISKILQFDVDGDKSLVVADKTLVEVAERNMKGIVPLYYNMKKASSIPLTNKNIYNGLQAAFVGGNIGIYSNNISKIWNSDIFVNGTKKEKDMAINVIKLLCMENNFVIDYAKTLYKPERPDDINELITNMINDKLPTFFKYAKDKNNNQVTTINDSFVNKLNIFIPNPRINCRKLNIGEIDYKIMVNNPDIKFKVAFTDKGQLITDKTEPLIVKYLELNKDYKYTKLINSAADEFIVEHRHLLSNSTIRTNITRGQISENIKEQLSVFGYNDNEVCDILVTYLYRLTNSKSKSMLWMCYGDIILNNLKKHITINTTKVIQCIDCNNLFEVSINNKRTCRCSNCTIKHKRILKKEKMKRYRQKCNL